MQLGILVTDHGKHSVEKWAAHTASHIIQIASNAAGVQAIEARKLELKIIDVLEEHHGAVMEHEQGKLAEHGIERHDHPHEPEHFADEALLKILAAADGTRFEEHFAQSATVQHISKVLHEHFAASMDIERQWHPTHKAHLAQKAGA
jgi:hypothetical protein